MRRSHYIKQNHTSRVPLRMIWVDTEAVNEHGKPEAGRQSLTFGVALYESYRDSNALDPQHRDSFRFESASDFWDYVEAHTLGGRTLWIMAHNWNYDAGILNTSYELPKRGWELTKYINGKPPLIVRWLKNGAYITLVDTLNWFTSSLATLGTSVGLPKLAMPDSSAPVEEWDVYAWRDVEIIKAAMLAFRAFIREHDLGVMQPTLASQAFNAFRHRFMSTEILIHDNASALALERDAYHGGRTEAFWNGEVTEPVWKLDINSMYPAIMKFNPFSVRLVAYFPSYKPAWWKIALEGYGMVARCRIDTDEPVYGVVRNSRLIFPIGRFETTLSTPEILYAQEHGHIVEVYDWAYYEREYAFTEFVDYFYELRSQYRKEGDEANSFMCKILLNSFYGKWGQSGRKWVESTEYTLIEPGELAYYDEDINKTIKLRTRLGKTQQLITEPESENSSPVIAAEVTAYGRIQLWNLIKQAGKENVYYIDTDSLVVNADGFWNLQSSLSETALGALKVEWLGNDGEFWAPKDYRLGDDWKIKGISKKATLVAPNTYEQDQFRSWDFNLKNQVDGFIDVIRVTKDLKRVNKKAIVHGVGLTSPLELNEW